MKALERDVILNEAKEVRNGCITRICYKTELPVKAEFKHQGYKVYKVVETSARLGVNYHKIASVIARKAEEGLKETIQRANNYYEWVLANKVRHNTNTGKDYLYVASFNKGHHTKSYFVVCGPDATTEWLTAEDFIDTYKGILIPSYWNNRGQGGSEVKNISFENIYRIGGSGEKIDTLYQHACQF